MKLKADLIQSVACCFPDLNDLQSKGALLDILTHEMAHALGFGSLWDSDKEDLLSPANCQQYANAGMLNIASFTGPNTNAALPSIKFTAMDMVPVHTGGGSGSACHHWSEDFFKTELMTSTIYVGGASKNPLSIVTAQSMRDIGYTIDPKSSAIDKFDVTLASSARMGGEVLELHGCMDPFHSRGSKFAVPKD